MSGRYTADGRRRSSMTHATRSQECDLPNCAFKAYGNGGVVSHGRGHVRRGEAVELVKGHTADGYAYDSPVRVFLPVNDTDQIAELLARGFEQVTA